MISKSKQLPPNRDLVVYALYLMGGDAKRVSTEDIALKCFELFPESFSWVNYEQYPDKDIVRVGLTDARKESYGALVAGRAGQTRGHAARTKRESIPDGWMLTLHGIEWIRENLSRFQQFDSSGQMKEHRQKVLRQLKRVKDHHLFREYSANPGLFRPMIGDIADLLRCRVDAEPAIWLDRFDKIQNQAEASSQSEVVEFIVRCREAYLEQR